LLVRSTLHPSSSSHYWFIHPYSPGASKLSRWLLCLFKYSTIVLTKLDQATAEVLNSLDQALNHDDRHETKLSALVLEKRRERPTAPCVSVPVEIVKSESDKQVLINSHKNFKSASKSEQGGVTPNWTLVSSQHFNFP